MNKHLKLTLYTLLAFSNAIHAETPNQQLFRAAIQNNVAAATAALANGANIKAAYNHRTPLHEAAFFGNVDVITLLLARNADIEIQDNDGCTPLHLAACHSNINAMALLLDHGANINSSNRYGATPLNWAAFFSNINTMTLLLNRGATLEAQDTNGDTPLNFAIDYGDVEATALLLSRGALSIKTPAPWWWNRAHLSSEQRLIKHMIAIAQATTKAQFIALQAQQAQLQPFFDQQSDIIQANINFLYQEALTRTSHSLASQAFRVVRKAVRTQPKTNTPDPNTFSSYYLGDGTDLDWIHANALAQLKAQQQENQNALPIAPASSLPDDFEAPKRKRDDENKAQQSHKKKTNWFPSCEVQ
jgi:hypothetical protein